MDEQGTTTGGLPLGLCRQAIMKLESFAADVREIMEDEDLQPGDREDFEKIADMAALMGATIINKISREIGEEEFLAEQPQMDEIDDYPVWDGDLMDAPIDNPQ